MEKHQVLDFIHLLPREEPHSAACGSAYRKGGIVGLRSACKRLPACTEVLTRYVRQLQPDAIFSSIAILDNVPSGFHKDVANAHCDNYVLKMSDFSGGGVWCENAQGKDIRSINGAQVPGHVLTFCNDTLRLPAYKALRATEPWSGSRIVLISYCLQNLCNLSPAHANQLAQLGFQPDLATGDLHASTSTHAPCPTVSDTEALMSTPSGHSGKPPVLELCAGTAGLSAALIELNFDAVAFDHRKIPGAKSAIQIADLCSEHGFALAKRLLLHPRCAGFFAAPVCGTASRAREIASVQGPNPLRSEESQMAWQVFRPVTNCELTKPMLCVMQSPP